MGASTYLCGAHTAVFFLLKGRGRGLGRLDKLKLALAARHARGFGHLDDAANGELAVGVKRGERVVVCWRQSCNKGSEAGFQDRFPVASGGGAACGVPRNLVSHRLLHTVQLDCISNSFMEGENRWCLSWLLVEGRCEGQGSCASVAVQAAHGPTNSRSRTYQCRYAIARACMHMSLSVTKAKNSLE